MNIQPKFENTAANQNINSNATTNRSVRNTFTLLGMLAILLFGLMPNGLKAGGACLSHHSSYSGGFIVVMQGLVDQDVVLEFGTKKTDFQNGQVTATIFSNNGKVVYEQTSSTPVIDFSSLSLPSGNYTLSVQAEGTTQSITFSTL